MNVQAKLLVEARRDATQGVSSKNRRRKRKTIDVHVTAGSIVERDDVTTSTLVERPLVDACSWLGIVFEVSSSFAIVSMNSSKRIVVSRVGTTHPER
jgi:hypothetical protein